MWEKTQNPLNSRDPKEYAIAMTVDESRHGQRPLRDAAPHWAARAIWTRQARTLAGNPLFSSRAADELRAYKSRKENTPRGGGTVIAVQPPDKQKFRAAFENLATLRVERGPPC